MTHLQFFLRGLAVLAATLNRSMAASDPQHSGLILLTLVFVAATCFLFPWTTFLAALYVYLVGRMTPPNG